MKTEAVEYHDGATACRGILAYEENRGAKRPGVLLVPDIRGVGLRPKAFIDLLTAEGYVVLIADMYGHGINMRDREHGQELIAQVRSSEGSWRRRVRAALDALIAQPQVDTKRVGAVGFCFGGGTVLELALSGADIEAAVIMHGIFEGVRLEDAANIKARILFCAGVDDPLLPTDQVVGMQEAFRRAGVPDWEVITFGNTKHGFTNVDAPQSAMIGYNKIADHRAQAAMMGIFKESFA